MSSRLRCNEVGRRGILIFSSICAVVVSLLVAAVTRPIARYVFQRARAENTVVVVAILAGMISLPPIFMIVVRTLTAPHIGLTGEEASGVLSTIGVPASDVSDVCWRHSVGGSMFMDFDISESDFLAWMISKRWQVQRFLSYDESILLHWKIDGRDWSREADVYPVRNKDFLPIKVQSGYLYFDIRNEDPDSSTTNVYDRNAGRAYIMR